MEPSVEPTVETPAETPSVEPEVQVTPETPVVETPQAEVSLYELPDGRKVDAETLQREWKENFYPEYTRKSQKLSEYENLNKPKENVPEWQRPDYVPQSYAEVIELAKREAIQTLKSEQEAERARIQEVSAKVDAEIAELKKADPSLDENALFLHANKWGFRDLKSAHANMREMKQAALSAEERAVKNLKARSSEPLATPGATSTDGDAISYADIASGKYGSALEYFQRINKK